MLCLLRRSSRILESTLQEIEFPCVYGGMGKSASTYWSQCQNVRHGSSFVELATLVLVEEIPETFGTFPFVKFQRCATVAL
jgi:hypothetical protein